MSLINFTYILFFPRGRFASERALRARGGTACRARSTLAVVKRHICAHARKRARAQTNYTCIVCIALKDKKNLT